MRKLFQWVKDNPNRAMFLVPILLVAGISISHVVSWYDIANPINWAIYLSIAIEVGAMTALVAATNKIKGGVWFMFGLVTLIQMIGNIFFSFKEIDVNGDLFKSWVELTSPLWEMLGSDPGDVISQKRWLAFLEGGLLPIISLTSLHFFTKYDRNRSDDNVEVKEVSQITKPDEDISDEEYEQVVQDFVRKQKEQAEKVKYTPSEEDFKKLDEFLRNVNYDGPSKEEVDPESIKYTPTEEELNKIEDILFKYSKPESVEVTQEEPQEKEEESILSQLNELMRQPEEPIFYEPEEIVETPEEIQEEEMVEDLEVTPEPIEEVKTNKVLNYFK
jgi:hypothetical protein